MTVPCNYCETNSKKHIDAGKIMGVIDELPVEQRAIIVAFIKQVEQPYMFHVAHALDVVYRVCEFCGEDKEREDDGDRYYWICNTRNCIPNNQ